MTHSSFHADKVEALKREVRDLIAAARNMQNVVLTGDLKHAAGASMMLDASIRSIEDKLNEM